MWQRALANRIQSAYPAGMVIDNRPGAGARLAIDHVKNSPPDGTTMLFTPDFPITIYPHSYRKLAYDSLNDLTPVAIVARTPLAFVVGPAVPESVKTVADFLAWAKANPKLAAFSSSAARATPHFAGVMFSRAAGVDLLHVAYKGGAPAMQDKERAPPVRVCKLPVTVCVILHRLQNAPIRVCCPLV